MASFSSLLGGWWRSIRDTSIAGRSRKQPDQKLVNIDEAIASATTDRIQRIVQEASRAPLEDPEEDAPSENPTRELWGKKFAITPQGLSEEQVKAYVEELLARNKELEQQGTAATMTNYVQKLMGELQQVEESIHAQARREAEAEAAKITAEANRKAQETMNRVRTEAVEMAQREADAVLTEARKRAEIADGQIRIQTQLMLGKARDQIEERIRKEGETGYYRLLASLGDLIQEAQRIDSEWKQHRAQLWRGNNTNLALGAVGLSALPIIQEALSPTLEPEEAAPEEPERPDISNVVGIPKPALDSSSAAEAQVEALVEEPEPALEPESPEEPTEKQDDTPQVDEATKRALYVGEVELVLTPPVDPAILARLYSRLLASEDVRILRSVGSWDSGATITLALERPQPLIDLLLGIPEIRIATNLSDQGAGSSVPGQIGPGARISISLGG